jgi:hypothetical protein
MLAIAHTDVETFVDAQENHKKTGPKAEKLECRPAFCND